MLVAISVSLSYLSATFDSLFEIHVVDYAASSERRLEILSILYLRCRLELDPARLRLEEAFNSLFEMPQRPVPGLVELLQRTFNSLFEMLQCSKRR